MSIIINCQTKTLTLNSTAFPCRIGRGGFINGDLGREGDEKTPLGNYHLRFGLYRADRLPPPPSALSFWPIGEDDGWCDDPESSAYNRYIRLPFEASCERLWRADGAYDIILVMNHNDEPPIAGKGSAVFIHVAQSDERQTLGCVAVTPEVMVKLLPHIKAGTEISIKA